MYVCANSDHKEGDECSGDMACNQIYNKEQADVLPVEVLYGNGRGGCTFSSVPL